jgi:hypothetical protein
MAWTNKKGFNFRSTIGFATDNAGEIAVLQNTSFVNDLPPYSGTGAVSPLTLDGDTFSIGWNHNDDGARDRSANIPSSSDHRLAGIHAPLGTVSGLTLKIQAGTAPGNYKVWAGFCDQGNGTPGTVSFTLRDSNGTLTSQSGLAALTSNQVYDIKGNKYTTGANWAAASDGAGVAFTFSTSDTSNGNGGPFIFLDIGNGTTYTPLSHFAIQYLGPGGPTLVQKTTANQVGSASSFTVQLAGVAAGNFLTLQASLITAGSGASNVSMSLPTDTNGQWQFGTNYSGNHSGGAGAVIAGIAYQHGAPAGTHTVTVSAGGFSVAGHATLCEWANIPGNATADVTAFSNATTAQANTSGTTTVIASSQELVLAALVLGSGAGVANAAITDPPAGFTSLYVQNATNTDIGVEHAYLVSSSQGTQVASWSWTDATTILSQGVIAAFQPFGTQVQVFFRGPQHFVDENLIQM